MQIEKRKEKRMSPNDTVITIVLAIIGSGGFWALLQVLVTRLTEKKTATAKMLLGLGHEHILQQCAFFEQRGYITADEYTELDHYLYSPYKALGGNGAVEREMKKVQSLPSEKPKRTKQEV